MEGSRSEQAIRRIEAALHRIEAVAGTAALGPESELAARHHALRSEVSAVLGELDRLIEGIAR